MADVLFYQLERQPLEQVLPVLLDKTLKRGWRAVVRTGSRERTEALSAVLWTWRDDAFLPHGTAIDGHGAEQPIWLTCGDDIPNGATVLFLTDGATIGEWAGLERCVFLFDGRDDDAVARAREEWKACAKSGHAVTYWRQDEKGRWRDMAKA